MEILVVDIETTGFYAKSDAIVEIGIALVNTSTRDIKLVFDKVVRDTKFTRWMHKNAWIFKNTTLTVDDVEDADLLDNYHSEIQQLFDKYPVTAYNKSFDLRFLRNNGFVINDVRCLMKTATKYSTFKDKNGRVKKPSVEEIYNQFFMTPDNVYVESHRAGQDVVDESKILLHMVDLKQQLMHS